MADAILDANHFPTLTAVSNVDGVTPVVLWADPTTHRLLTSTSSTPAGSDTYVQFNDGGVFGGVANLTFDKTNITLSIGGADSMSVNGSAVTTRLAVHQTDSATNASIEKHQYSNTAGRGAVTYFARSRGTKATPLVVQSGDTLGQIDALGYDGTDYATSASIEFEVDGTPGANDMPGRIVFKTSPDGSQTLATALTIARDKSATFAGTVIMPTPFTLGATSVTTTGTQLNYLNAATGTTGTASTNLVFSTSPTLVTPVLGVATATSINGISFVAVSGGSLQFSTNSTITFSGSVTYNGTNSTTMTFPSTSSTLVGRTTTDTLTNKTLTAPKIANAGFIADANGNEQIIFTTTASAVNEITLANAATGNNPTITASGGDANVGFNFLMKGTGTFNLKGNATQAAELRLYEDTDNGTNYTAFKVGVQTGDVTYTLPTADGSSGQVLSTNGSGTLSWASSGGFTTAVRAYASATTSVSNSGATKIALATENYDIGGNFATSTFTAPAAGRYLVTGQVSIGVADQKYVIAYIYVNGARVAQNIDSASGTSASVFCPVSDILNLSQNDTVELYAEQGDTTAKNCDTGSDVTYLAVARIQ